MDNQTLSAEDALDFVIQEARRLGADQCDAIATESEIASIRVYQRQSAQTTVSQSHVIQLRVWRGDRLGRASTERFSRDALQQAARDALSHSELTDPIPVDLPEPQSLPEIDLRIYNPALEEIGLNHFREFCIEIEELARTGHPHVENVVGARGGRSASRKLVGNSHGVRYGSRRNVVSADVSIVAARDGSRKSSSYGRGGLYFGLLDATRIAATAVERGVEMLGSAPVPSGHYPIVFSSRIAHHLLQLYTSSFHAERVQKGESRLVDKIDTIVAAHVITLVSNPHLPGEPGSDLFDSEGVPGELNTVIEGGVLKTYFYNLEAARRAGHRPNGAGPYNWRIERGQQTLSQLLATFPRCLYITGLKGAAGCSATSGEISIGAEGFLHENGVRVRPVDQITLSGNFFELLHSVRGLSNEYDDAWASVKVPDLLVESMAVAG